ncbi:hypothetical protein FQN54_006168 [Arachnomyces sp. PD_36]|nr:hypothetical protein FQN54_006168 [Arachnomyces sp. PD_36]
MPAITAHHQTLPSGRVLWAETYGHGPPGSPAILFANGMASTTNAWNSLVHTFPEALLANHTVVLHDAANTGKSPHQANLPAPSLASLATEARQLLQHLGFSSGYFVGHSFGAQQGYVAAALDPGFWQGLLLLAPQTDRVTPRTAKFMKAMMDIYDKDPETAAYAEEVRYTPGTRMVAKNGIYGAFAREMALRQRSEGLALAFKALLEPKEGDFAWKDMKTRIVIVHGGEDELAPVSEGEYALRMLRAVEGADAELLVLPESGHWMNWENEEWTRDQVLKLVGFSREGVWIEE